MTRRLSEVLLAATWLATTSLSCDLFRPATPEPPSGGAITPDYSSPEGTLEAIAAAIQDKARTNGQSVYVRALADTTFDGRGFHAFFDPITVTRYGREIPPDWNLRLETNFYARFVTIPVAATSEYAMRWGEDPDASGDQVDPVAGTALLHRKYEVFATLDTGDAILIANGFADLYFVRVSSDRWAMTRWQDREDPAPAPNPEAVSLGQRRLETQ